MITKKERQRKLIKFGLRIDGVKVTSLEELQEHFTTEVIEHFRSGLLAKWLQSRGMTDKQEAVEQLNAEDDAIILAELCNIFGIEADAETIAEAVAEATGIRGIRLRHPKDKAMNGLEKWVFTTVVGCLAVEAKILQENDLKELWCLLMEAPEREKKLTDIRKGLVQWFCSATHGRYLTGNALPWSGPPSAYSARSTKRDWQMYVKGYIQVMDPAIATLESCPDDEIREDLIRRLENEIALAHKIDADGVDRGRLDKDALTREVFFWRKKALKVE